MNSGVPVNEAQHLKSVSPMMLFVADLSIRCTAQHLQELLGTLVISIKSKIEVGYGFLSFATETEALTAMKTLQGRLFYGRTLRFVT